MFCYPFTVRMRETDATKNIYFTALFDKSVETFEAWLKETGFGYQIPVPIVNAEANYLAPIQLGHELEVRMRLTKMGTSSFTLSYEFIEIETQVVAGNASITHVCLSESGSIPIPEKLASLLRGI